MHGLDDFQVLPAHFPNLSYACRWVCTGREAGLGRSDAPDTSALDTCKTCSGWPFNKLLLTFWLLLVKKIQAVPCFHTVNSHCIKKKAENTCQYFSEMDEACTICASTSTGKDHPFCFKLYSCPAYAATLMLRCLVHCPNDKNKHRIVLGPKAIQIMKQLTFSQRCTINRCLFLEVLCFT